MSTTPPEEPGAVPPPPPTYQAPTPPPPSSVPPPAGAVPPPPQYAPQPPIGGGAPALGVPRPAELLDRFLARLIDGVITGIVFGILYAILGAIFISSAHFRSDGTYDDGSTVLFLIIFGIVFGALNFAYYVYLESSRGQTIGKQIMKLRVYGPDGTSNPTMEQAARRNIWEASFVLYIIPVLGQIVAGLAVLAAEIYAAVTINNDTMKRQGWHDKFAGGTTVVKIG